MTMTHITPSIAGAAAIAATLAMLATDPALAASELSPAQVQFITHKAARMSKDEKAAIAGWSDAQKLAEFFCSPAALREFKKSQTGADRVALGPDAEGVKQFVLDGNVKLSGRGTVRIAENSKSYTFECTLDPIKPAVKTFTYKMQ